MQTKSSINDSKNSDTKGKKQYGQHSVKFITPKTSSALVDFYIKQKSIKYDKETEQKIETQNSPSYSLNSVNDDPIELNSYAEK